jgi:hypothetical protein
MEHNIFAKTMREKKAGDDTLVHDVQSASIAQTHEL